MKKTRWLLAVMVLLAFLSGCGGNPAEVPSAPAATSPAATEPEEKEILLEEQEIPGDNNVNRPEVTMLVQNYQNGNIIEIPQLTWENPAQETPAGRSVNEKILAFANGYEDYVDGHPEEYNCAIQSTAHFIGSEVVIVMQRFDTPSYGVDPEIATFSYDYVQEQEYGNEDQGSTELSQEEIMAKISEQAAAETKLEVTEAELSGYAWLDYGQLYFYKVTAKNADGDPNIQYWAWLEEMILDEHDDIWRGKDAFALLKEIYPDLPPDFDSERALAAPKMFVAILLPFDAMDEGKWVYSAEGAGKIAEATWDEYAEQELAERVAENSEDDGMIQVTDEIAPGTVAFVFRGVQAGKVELAFVCAEQELEEAVTIEVFPDLTLSIVSAASYLLPE